MIWIFNAQWQQLQKRKIFVLIKRRSSSVIFYRARCAFSRILFRYVLIVIVHLRHTFCTNTSTYLAQRKFYPLSNYFHDKVSIFCHLYGETVDCHRPVFSVSGNLQQICMHFQNSNQSSRSKSRAYYNCADLIFWSIISRSVCSQVWPMKIS